MCWRVIFKAVLLGMVLLSCSPEVRADGAALVPVDSIPKLPESFDFIDYKSVMSGGTLMPDRIEWNSVSIRTGTVESSFRSGLPESTVVVGDVQQRSREQQWQFIRELLAASNYSMHYYILAGIYYDEQLGGWFETIDWLIDSVGSLCIHLHSNKENGPYRVWLLQLTLDPVSPERVAYAGGPGFVLVRSGKPEVTWDVNKNRVAIHSDTPSAPNPAE
jgi:hypothetical protein